MTGYGLTEAGTITASRPGDSSEDIATTVGTPCEGFELRIAADGEVLARGYAVMKGYFADEKATAEAIDADGWLHTGDLGTIDAGGRLKIIGRKKDMFIVGGHPPSRRTLAKLPALPPSRRHHRPPPHIVYIAIFPLCLAGPPAINVEDLPTM